MSGEQTKAKNRLFWIVITALVGTIITVIVTKLVQEVSRKEPQLSGTVDFNSLAGRELQGQFITLVGLHYEGDQTIEGAEILVDLEQGGASDFRLVELEPRASSMRCVTEYEAKKGKIEVTANCEYLNPGDVYSFSVWHEGLLWQAAIRASAPGVTYSNYPNAGYEGLARTCEAVKAISKSMKKIPRTCIDSGYWE